MNNRPNMMDITPITTFNDVSPLSKDTKPKNNKLSPITIDVKLELKIGKIIKINPKIIDIIPAILFVSIFFPPYFLNSPLKVKNELI